MKKRLISGLLVVCLSVVFLAACQASALSPDNNDMPNTGPEAAIASSSPQEGVSFYRIEKIREINDKIIDREVIESSYFYYISDEEVLANIERYNKLTAQLTQYSALRAAGIMVAVFVLEDESGDPLTLWAPAYLEFSDVMQEMIKKIAKLSLYENSEELMLADPDLAYILSSESGGSYGLWYAHWHPSYIGMDNEDMKNSFLEYFELEKTLYAQLEELMNQ